MKANVQKDKPKFLQDMLTGGEQLADELKVILDNFDKWLELSHLTREELLKFCSAENFEIASKVSDGYTVIQLFNGLNKIGETIAYPSGNKEAEYDIAFLLLYIACQLDQHDSSNRDGYFFGKTKAFCEKNIFSKE